MIYATTMPPIVSRLGLKQGKILYVLPQKMVENKSPLIHCGYVVTTLQRAGKK